MNYSVWMSPKPKAEKIFDYFNSDGPFRPEWNGPSYSSWKGMAHFIPAIMEWTILFRPEWNGPFHSSQSELISFHQRRMYYFILVGVERTIFFRLEWYGFISSQLSSDFLFCCTGLLKSNILLNAKTVCTKEDVHTLIVMFLFKGRGKKTMMENSINWAVGVGIRAIFHFSFFFFEKWICSEWNGSFHCSRKEMVHSILAVMKWSIPLQPEWNGPFKSDQNRLVNSGQNEIDHFILTGMKCLFRRKMRTLSMGCILSVGTILMCNHYLFH